MTDKKKTIKTIALVLVSVIFLVMFYFTFFKAKKNRPLPAEEKRKPGISRPLAGISRGALQNTFGVKKADTDTAGITPWPPFDYPIKDIFAPPNPVATVQEKKTDPMKPAVSAVKNTVAAKKPQPLSEQEKTRIQQAFHFKGSILSNTTAVAIINGAFLHVGDSVNGYTISAISAQQVSLDTGHGMITLEIMKHE